MKFHPAKISGAFVVELDKKADFRGFFARAWSSKQFQEQGLVSQFVEWNLSQSTKKGTIRGLHWQEAPHGETKLLRCVRGEVFLVIADVRSDSPTKNQWEGFHLRPDHYAFIYTPEGCAHGFQTIKDDSEVFYGVSSTHTPEAERGLRWDDESFGIQWPLTSDLIISEKDTQWADYS